MILIFLNPANGLSENNKWCYEPWVGDSHVRIDIVDRIEENGTYSIYYSVGEEFVVTLDRDVFADTGWISLSRGGVGDYRVYYECDWVDYETSQKVIDELVTDVLNMVRE